MQDSAMFVRQDEDVQKLATPLQNGTYNPRIEFDEGQLLFSMMNQAGGIRQWYISEAAARAAFSELPVDSKWFNRELTCPGVCRWGDGGLGEWAVLFIPPAIHRLEISNDGSGEPYKADHLDVPLPALAFFGLNNNYYVFAMKTPTLDPYQELYCCPLPNVYASGEVCWGYLKPPRADARSIVDAWALFIKSTFNNHMANGKSKRCREDVRELLRELGGAADYPLKDLVQLHENGGRILDRVIREYFETGEMAG